MSTTIGAKMSRQNTIDDYAAYWWEQNSGETDHWEKLDADEREAVVENSMAETVADWIEDHKWREYEGGDTTPPPCPDHQERQHRDSQPPWCESCGWSHGVTVPARQIQ